MLIPLGYHCNISFLNQTLGIKKETSLFEWLEIRNLSCITNVINNLIIEPNQKFVFGIDKHICLLNDTNIYTGHYDIDEYEIIFKRRSERFLNIIKTNPKLFFVRINPIDKTTNKEEIKLFIKSIHLINPNVEIIFCLIDTIFKNSNKPQISINIQNIIFHHYYFYQEDVGNDVYLRENPIICETYKKILENIGYDINNKTNINFNDKN